MQYHNPKDYCMNLYGVKLMQYHNPKDYCMNLTAVRLTKDYRTYLTAIRLTIDYRTNLTAVRLSQCQCKRLPYESNCYENIMFSMFFTSQYVNRLVY